VSGVVKLAMRTANPDEWERVCRDSAAEVLLSRGLIPRVSKLCPAARKSISNAKSCSKVVLTLAVARQ